ncbi:MAG: transposase [Chloroflexia bacterium]|nr:transposase [Chloroflexia bacterium]
MIGSSSVPAPSFATVSATRRQSGSSRSSSAPSVRPCSPLSLLVDRAGTPLAVSVAPGNYHDGALRDILPDAAKTAEPTLLADKGYDSLRFQKFVHDHGFRPIIPARRCIPTEQATGELYAEDTSLQRKRYVVERTLGWLKGFRRLRYRVDCTAASFHAFVYLAILVLCVRHLVSQSRAGTPARRRCKRSTPAGTPARCD